MSGPRDESPYAPPKVPPREPQGDEARARGPLARALFAATFVAGIFAAGSLVYGMVKFSDGPIRATPSGYTNKSGAPRTREDYELYETWQRAVWISFGVTFLVGFSAAAADSRRKGR